MKYHYDAMNQAGQEIDGDIEAPSKVDALDKIRKMGHFPTRIREEGGEKPWKGPAFKSHEVMFVLWMAVLLAFFLIIPLTYWWNHDHLTKIQLTKEIWWTWAIGLTIAGVGMVVAHKWDKI